MKTPTLTLEILKKDREDLIAQRNAISGAIKYISDKILEIERAEAEACQEEKAGALRRMRKDAENNTPKLESVEESP